MSWLKSAVGGSVGYAIAGTPGAIVGAIAGRGRRPSDPGYDMSDIPFGVHVEAESEDDPCGRRWKLRFLSEIIGDVHAELRLLTDAGERVLGHSPFADEAGSFLAVAPIVDASSVIYVPHGAARYESPKRTSLEIAVAKIGAPPSGRAVLDPKLPPPGVWSPTEYLQPLVTLATHVLGDVDDASLTAMAKRLTEELELPADAFAEIAAYADADADVDDAIVAARFRFPLVSTAAHEALFQASCFADAPATPVQQANLARICAQLS